MDATDCKWFDISELLVLFASHQQLQLQFYIIIRILQSYKMPNIGKFETTGQCLLCWKDYQTCNFCVRVTETSSAQLIK